MKATDVMETDTSLLLEDQTNNTSQLELTTVTPIKTMEGKLLSPSAEPIDDLISVKQKDVPLPSEPEEGLLHIEHEVGLLSSDQVGGLFPVLQEQEQEANTRTQLKPDQNEHHEEQSTEFPAPVTASAAPSRITRPADVSRNHQRTEEKTTEPTIRQQINNPLLRARQKPVKVKQADEHVTHQTLDIQRTTDHISVFGPSESSQQSSENEQRPDFKIRENPSRSRGHSVKSVKMVIPKIIDDISDQSIIFGSTVQADDLKEQAVTVDPKEQSVTADLKEKARKADPKEQAVTTDPKERARTADLKEKARIADFKEKVRIADFKEQERSEDPGGKSQLAGSLLELQLKRVKELTRRLQSNQTIGKCQ